MVGLHTPADPAEYFMLYYRRRADRGGTHSSLISLVFLLFSHSCRSLSLIFLSFSQVIVANVGGIHLIKGHALVRSQALCRCLRVTGLF